MRVLAVPPTALALVVAAGFLPAGQVAQDPEPPESTPAVMTPELDDLAIGRFWHERERLVAAAVGSGLLPDDQLRLAEAEAGWGNWSAVIDILDDAEWRDRLGNGRGAYLFARALERTDDTDGAVAAYEHYLSVAPLGSPDATTTRVRLARLLAADDRLDDAIAHISDLQRAPSGLSSWVALDLADREARSGNVSNVSRLFGLIADPGAEAEKWELLPRAHLNGDDSDGALLAYEEILSQIDDPTDRARVWATIGELRQQRRNTEGAREAYLNALDTGAETEAAVRASVGLRGMGVDDPGLALKMARALEGARRSDDAIEAYALYARLAGADARPEARLAEARLRVGKRQNSAAVDLLLPLAASSDQELAPRAIESLIQVRQRQGRSSAVADLEQDLIDRFPESSQSASVLFFRGDTHHDDGEFSAAIEDYRLAAEYAPATMRGGLSAMRMGQIYITRGQFEEAARVFERYLDAAPTGSYAEEATYWAARSWLEIEERDRASALLVKLQDTSPVSYYAVQTADLTGDDFSIPVVESRPVPTPPWLTTGLQLLDIAGEADLGRAERMLAARLVERARSANDVTLLQVAKGFHSLQRNLEAIQIGWEVQRRGHPWDRLLLEVIYPFPFREMVVEEAREAGLDPFLMAALIRQESAWVANARSVANARGLMQVMPATGRELARSVGPRGFSTPKLYVPDVNLHLGATYLKDMLGRYDGRLPLVLSAYNAGPHRASRWQRFPEVEDPVRFTERIPFRETRGYVKNVTRNYRVYQFLYGE